MICNVLVVVLLVHETCTGKQLSVSSHLRAHGRERIERTLQRREATVHDQFEITKLTLGQNGGGEGLSLRSQLVMARGIAGVEVLQDTTVGRIGHFESNYRIRIYTKDNK